MKLILKKSQITVKDAYKFIMGCLKVVSSDDKQYPVGRTIDPFTYSDLKNNTDNEITILPFEGNKED